ncbi:MAG: nicotinate phosphoribosyltransferase [Halobacteriota archaeon]|nr:nicotinate phosphoribosyltransferase [Halobacteriota archaeon]
MGQKFSIIDDEEIRDGLATDVYFLRTEEILRAKDLNPYVIAEVSVSDGDWGILTGLEDVAKLLEGKALDVYGMEEGTLFLPREPVLRICGRYLEFARFETAILGMLCHSSGIATKAARIKALAGDIPVISFGSRRQHPALALLIERSAYIGGMDGISNVAAGMKLGIEPTGTMPHALIICFGDQKAAFEAFDEVIDPDVKRICLCDTYSDEKEEALTAFQTLGERLEYVRFDSPYSRKGDFGKIIEEVRWELDIRNGGGVKIFVSGGLDEKDIVELRDVVDGFGVGSCVSNAKAVNFSLDIVEKENVACAKRGKFGGAKEVYRSWENLQDRILIRGEEKPGDMEPLLSPIMKEGEIVADFSMSKARERVLSQIGIAREKGFIV